MGILGRLARVFKRRGEPHETGPVLDDLRGTGASGDWRKRKLAEAAEKYGRPFKCAGDDLPHEVVLPGRGISKTHRYPRG
jgi:hypothetical protein